jgi:CarboxypepD_reg-like domain
MIRPIAILLLCLFCWKIAFPQTTLKGEVYNKRHQPVIGASIIVTNTLTATITDSSGRFILSNVKVNDTLRLKISSLGFETVEKIVPPAIMHEIIVIKLAEQFSKLDDVVISAGSFEASAEKRTTILKPFDLVTTPTAGADLFKAIEQLPGTSKVGESEGLFVRGGDATETKAVIDGLIVQDPFFSSLPGVAQKGRFSPLLFKGTSFSTGGYSAQYGQALSSVLLLTTQDVAQASSSTIILNNAGISGNTTQKWDNASLAVNANYFNLRPSFYFNKQNFTYDKAPEGGGGNIIFRKKGRNGVLFKLFASYQLNVAGLQIPFLSNDGRNVAYSLNNKNLFLNSTLKFSFRNWRMNAGISYSDNNDDAVYNTVHVLKVNNRIQSRLVLTKAFAKRTKLHIGSELQYVKHKNRYTPANYALNDLLVAGFAEAEFYIGRKIAARTGIRNEFSTTNNRVNSSPRVSLAYVLTKYSQFSVAYGDFYQLPAETYLFNNGDLLFEKSSHYIINYQLVKNNRTFRIEAYYKDYNHLVKDPDSTTFYPFIYNRIPSSNTNNDGFGYAKGIDIFWYDKTSINHLDYWISYSFLDTKRLYQNYPVEAMPIFASHHNLSLVVKYNIPKTSVNIGISYNYTSGRPYYDPNNAFLSDKTPPVHNLVFSGNYAWFFKNNLFAVFAYIDNIAGIKNVYNYFFSADGKERYSLTPPAYRSIYAGINITLAKRRTIMGINF